MYAFSLLVNAKTIEEMQSHLQKMKILFNTEHQTDAVELAKQQLLTSFKRLGNISDKLQSGDSYDEDYDDDEDDDEDEEEELANIEVLKARKPFGRYFVERLAKVRTESDDCFPINPFYKPEYYRKIMNLWIPTCPIWSSILRGIFAVLTFVILI